MSHHVTSKKNYCFLQGVCKKKVSYMIFMIKDFFTLPPLPILLNKEICQLPKSAQRPFMDINNLTSVFPIFLSCTSHKIKCYTHQTLVSERKWTWVQINVHNINRYSQLSSLSTCYFEAMTLEVDKYYGCW